MFANERRQHTHDDRQICSFYMRTGACRFNDACSRKHPKPTRSRTVIFPRLFIDPRFLQRGRLILHRGREGDEPSIDETKLKADFDDLFKDLFIELSTKYGEILDMVVSENLNKHLSGNVYVKFNDEKAAARCVEACKDRWYDCRPIFCALSPVSNFDEASCRAYEEGTCDREGGCNYLHIRRVDSELENKLYAAQWMKYHGEEGGGKRS
ncbi:DEKNAAC104043 [Brettanomyces naardenensis]|uniref:DEKNAAC104043 n=1 Tax=Brettanomyces naardenensis TaxID=13370 RepID=A0A448YQE8_BRENA|nr:DEKNAAC104043 [Brettanomyces naardenensis]